MRIQRTLEPYLLDRATRHPVVTVTGPRQSGKTTLCRMAFAEKTYRSLEHPPTREFATEDPAGFLAQHGDGAVLDEVQRAPQLLSFLQGLVDEDPTPGRWVLTGSHNLGLLDAVTQSLAGRTAVLELLPMHHEEVRRFPAPPADLFDTLHRGGYPRIHEQGLPAAEWLAAYTATYVERDVRQILQVGDLVLFQTFLRLCAGRTGQLVNLASLANDCGVSPTTARSWLSVLEASYLVHRLPPFAENVTKRLVKSPKLYFWDAGLVCHLLGIERPEQLVTHPLRGPIFETWVVSEIAKSHLHRGRRPRLFFYAERGRFEVDLLLERGAELDAIEIKSGQTPSSAYLAAFDRLAERLAGGTHRLGERLVVFGGAEGQARSRGRLVPWHEISQVLLP